MSGNVVPIAGGPLHVPTVCPEVVAALEETLERARSGEVVAVALAVLHHDHAASGKIAGAIGGYSLLGALEFVKADLTRAMLHDG